MEIFGLEKLSLVDFDGHMCATVFTGRCNFRCPFCHNAPLVADVENQRQLNESEIFDFLIKRKGLLDAVCVSGGEPTVNADLDVFLKKIKDLGYAVKLDTNGSRPQVIEKLAREKLIDYVAMDIKNSREKYAATVGLKTLELSPIAKSVSFLKSGNVPYEFRTTLVKEYHNEKNMEDIAEWLDGAEILFLQKFTDSGNCLENNLHCIEKIQAENYASILNKKIKTVKLRGY